MELILLMYNSLRDEPMNSVKNKFKKAKEVINT